MKNLVRLVIILLAATVTCAATTVVPMSVEQLTRAASDVVEGRVLNSWSAWNPEHTHIFTYSTFQVTRSIKGAGTQTITIKQLGGSAEGYTQKVAGVHLFQAGEDALLFLRPSVAADSTMVVVGLMQGQFRVSRNAAGETIVSNGVYGAHALEQRTATTSTFAGSPISLSEAESRIRRAMQ